MDKKTFSYGVSVFRRFSIIPLALAIFSARAERINQEGRILGPAPVVTTPLLFNTAQADAIVSAMQIFPVTNPWNEDISRRPALTNSAQMIAQLKADLSSSRQTLRPFYEMNYVLVPNNQPRLSIPFLDYPDESDLDGGTFPNGSYPIPSNMPIEQWPKDTGGLTLQQWQMDVNNSGGDRHAIIVAPGLGSIWETWQTKLTQSGWEASNGAKFDLNSNALRPDGWTSGDAAGLPLFPALVRYDECQRGMVEHAMRLCVPKTRREYIYPANHSASSISATSINYPAMGQRFRLKASFVVPGGWTTEERAVCYALKKYGAIVADNSGGFFSISVCPDDRFSASAFNNLSTIDVSNFEVVQTTGPNEGPRSPGAPSVNAGTDQTVSDLSATLAGIVSDPSGNAAIQWRLYSGPAPVNFANSNAANAMVVFGQSGAYTFLLSADDGVHAVTYDAVIVNVQPGSPTPTPAPTPSPTPNPTPMPSPTPRPTPSPTPIPAPSPTPTPSPTPKPTATPGVTPTISVSASPVQITEGGNATFKISSSSILTKSVTINYSVSGTAFRSYDYSLSGTLGHATIPSGKNSTIVTLHAIVDHRTEPKETAIMTITTGAGYKLSSAYRATVTILNAP